ncbi:IclR family transcriptional regulator [Sphaerochaeta sp.]|jgi:DNA-binding IclR family transcriptional regulator|uniref:IclR family transcriptional regulator n=1 Tax=Sphaerochaeta sp. TaxID=1972642 RepID=UPI002A36C4D5|nr:IclR family transcriptional regulator [Sphaerochaeta sp.]MDX9983915.1 IclR family transcriptional regulator [Sphaerochaeta sp.]
MSQKKNHRLLEITFDIMKYIAQKDEDVGFKEICETFEIPKSTVHNLLHTMTNMNFLEKNVDTARYTIGLKCFEVGNAYLALNPFYSRAKEVVESISLTCNETTHFAILDGNEVVYLYKFDSMQPLRIFSHIGKRIPAHATAIGKAILSGLTREQLLALYPETTLPAMTNNTITDRNILLEQLELIRKDGVSFECEESTPFIQCFGVPIFSKQNKPIAGMSISLPVIRGEKNKEEFIRLLREGKRELEAMLL